MILNRITDIKTKMKIMHTLTESLDHLQQQQQQQQHSNSITLFRIDFPLKPLNLDLKSTLNLHKVPRNATKAHILQSFSLNHWIYLKPLKLSQSKLTSCELY